MKTAIPPSRKTATRIKNREQEVINPIFTRKKININTLFLRSIASSLYRVNIEFISTLYRVNDETGENSL